MKLRACLRSLVSFKRTKISLIIVAPPIDSALLALRRRASLKEILVLLNDTRLLKHALKNQRGSALLETVVCSVALLVFFSALLVSIYVLLAVYWADFWSYRAMICLLPESTPHRCEAQLISQLNLVIPRSHFRVEELWKTSNKTSVTVTIDLIAVNKPPKKTFHLLTHRIRKEISLPLTNGVSLSP